jgi:hypothetical protein
MDSSNLCFTHRLLSKLPANRNSAMLTLGDLRNWAGIDAWAGNIAHTLKGK